MEDYQLAILVMNKLQITTVKSLTLHVIPLKNKFSFRSRIIDFNWDCIIVLYNFEVPNSTSVIVKFDSFWSLT